MDLPDYPLYSTGRHDMMLVLVGIGFFVKDSFCGLDGPAHPATIGLVCQALSTKSAQLVQTETARCLRWVSASVPVLGSSKHYSEFEFPNTCTNRAYVTGNGALCRHNLRRLILPNDTNT